jgi:prepilin-type N-terminal cleavage/methylation domain-containing protein
LSITVTYSWKKPWLGGETKADVPLSPHYLHRRFSYVASRRKPPFIQFVQKPPAYVADMLERGGRGIIPIFKVNNVLSGRGFTLVELMVVILIVGILAAVAIPLMQGRIDKAKWSEANAAAGTIRVAVRVYAFETTIATAQALVGNTLDDSDTQGLLGIDTTDLAGTYFVAGDYEIASVNANGVAAITATASQGNAPTGSYMLEEDGDWVKQ